MALLDLAAKHPGGASAPEILIELGFPVDAELYRHALTHRSFAYENGGLVPNERLEFLGDAVLGIVVTDYLYRTFPESSEGELAKLRAAVVNSRALAGVARFLGLGSEIRLGKGELATGGRDKLSILADTVEAVIAAVYLTHGLDGAAAFIHRLFDPLVAEATMLGAGRDWKTSLQELASVRGLGVPSYDISSEGPDHNKVFYATALVGEYSFGPGTGGSKKCAEQMAAELGFKKLSEQTERGFKEIGVPTLPVLDRDSSKQTAPGDA